ncbi:hypothetical protein SIM91_43805 [Rhodococcus opacus]|uniref:hypothetical protein n=1 Tax=Rhodococcus opacus TaxID=37919 RepID=UPI0002A22395|nr:hypothetical protein [Rhodococcus opacus]ELB88624.1 hypothetical protein Rwratislav_33832 [Rhodococcus wratislaviensis IFP 2016]MDX5970081.1 hypothetical protein [Rhodococcus opacus]CAG7634041.1 hypothetical protein E143388_07563 [Rhodococcus opacus]
MSTALYFAGLILLGIGGLGDDLVRGLRPSAHQGAHKISMGLALAGVLCWTVGAVVSDQPLWWKIVASVFVLTIGFLLTVRSRFLPRHQGCEPDE